MKYKSFILLIIREGKYATHFADPIKFNVKKLSLCNQIEQKKL